MALIHVPEPGLFNPQEPDVIYTNSSTFTRSSSTWTNIPLGSRNMATIVVFYLSWDDDNWIGSSWDGSNPAITLDEEGPDAWQSNFIGRANCQTYMWLPSNVRGMSSSVTLSATYTGEVDRRYVAIIKIPNNISGDDFLFDRDAGSYDHWHNMGSVALIGAVQDRSGQGASTDVTLSAIGDKTYYTQVVSGNLGVYTWRFVVGWVQTFKDNRHTQEPLYQIGGTSGTINSHGWFFSNHGIHRPFVV